MRDQPILQATAIAIATPSGRPLIEDLDLNLDNENVAMIGHNGVGKSTLLNVLAGRLQPTRGVVTRCVDATVVAQEIDAQTIKPTIQRLYGHWDNTAIVEDLESIGLPPLEDLQNTVELSEGERRKLSLLAAKYSSAPLVFLDEPSVDLDAQGIRWVSQWIRSTSQCMFVVTHDEKLLPVFQHFFAVAESGCRYYSGTFAEVEASMEVENAKQRRQYLRNLNSLTRKEEHSALVSRRRQRKKMGGRVREIVRAPSRSMLNSKRSYAQESQAKRRKIQEERIVTARAWTKATRRALAVQLALAPRMPRLPLDDGLPAITLHNIGLTRNKRNLFSDIQLRVGRQKVAITGPNGSGKTSLLQVILGTLPPSLGCAKRRSPRIGCIAQGGANWMLGDSLVERLATSSPTASPDRLAELLVAHQFPLSLAMRPLRSLSPGERVRAALLCLFEQSPCRTCLVLDEPTYSLDFVGAKALQEVLALWAGGLVVVSHDRTFLHAIGIEQEIQL